jgi:hypothetical protein
VYPEGVRGKEMLLRAKSISHLHVLDPNRNWMDEKWMQVPAQEDMDT